MKILRIFSRSIRNAWHSLIRNFSLSMASVTCTIITLLLVSIGLILSFNVNNITDNILDEFSIVVFMDRNLSKETLDETFNKLKQIDNVRNVTSNYKEDIKTQMANENDTFKKVIETWDTGENPFQDSYIVEVQQVKDAEETATTIKNLDNVDFVKYSKTMVSEVVKIFNVVRTATIILVVGLILVTAFLINNTIKITIFSRKREIDIMRLVGTSNTVIKVPFLIEGFLIGLFGSIIPILLTIFGYKYIFAGLERLASSTESANLLTSVFKLVEPNNIVYKISLLLLLVAIIVGMLASVRAVRKNLKI